MGMYTRISKLGFNVGLILRLIVATNQDRLDSEHGLGFFLADFRRETPQFARPQETPTHQTAVKRHGRQERPQCVARSVARSLGRSFAPSLDRSLGRSIARSLVRSIARSLGRSIGRSVARSIARSLARSLGRSADRSIARSVARSIDRTLGRWVARKLSMRRRKSQHKFREISSGWPGLPMKNPNARRMGVDIWR